MKVRATSGSRHASHSSHCARGTITTDRLSLRGACILFITGCLSAFVHRQHGERVGAIRPISPKAGLCRMRARPAARSGTASTWGRLRSWAHMRRWLVTARCNPWTRHHKVHRMDMPAGATPSRQAVADPQEPVASSKSGHSAAHPTVCPKSIRQLEQKHPPQVRRFHSGGDSGRPNVEQTAFATDGQRSQQTFPAPYHHSRRAGSASAQGRRLRCTIRQRGSASGR